MARSREEYLRAKRESMARQRARDPAAHRAKQKTWCDKNRDQVRQNVRNYHNRRFFWTKCCRLRREEDSAVSPRDLASLWKQQKGRCGLTGVRLSRESAELDHILPKARGGSGCLENLRWVTKAVNRAKRDLTDAEFFNLCSNVMRWLGTRIQMVSEIADAQALEAAE